ncbi:MAG TPA: LacI family DNA-binding transcriptional regulator [Bryobacteraceae bacterium]|nr:LacI family DNA-binding transcriptional regulator [Bryobacteraceae bacterium]
MKPREDAPAAVKRASIKDIAQLANVSHSTVSRALRSSRLISEATAGRIRRIAREAGYAPSAAARSLVTRRSDAIGVVVTNIADPFVAGVVSGIEEVATEKGYSVFLANSHADPEREVRVAQSLEERRVDGIIVTSSRVGAMYVPLLSRMRVPIVLLNNQHPSEFVHSVMIANAEAALEATRHLVGLGHRHIAYLGDRYGHQSETERFSGYRRALEEAGLALEPELVAQGDGKPEGAGPAMAHLLALPHPPTAVFCYNDLSALGAMREAFARDLRVPSDLSIVGFDDLYISRYLNPPLTTVRQPMHQMGRMAMETLLDLLAGGRRDHNLKVPGDLIVRESTAPPKERI